MASQAVFVALDQLRLRAQALRLGLHGRLDEILVSDFPGSSPESVLELLQVVLEHLKGEIDKADNESTLLIYCSVLLAVGSWLEFFDNADTQQTPRGLVQLLEDLIRRLTPDATVLVWPQAEYNYSIRDLLRLIENATDSLIPEKQRVALLARFKGPLNLISFPRIERDNVMMHAMLGHEIGHPLAAAYLQQEETSPEYQRFLKTVTDTVNSAIEAACEGKPGVQALKYGQALLDTVLQLRKRALQELLSDAVAVYSFGPSALFALYEFLIAGGWDDPPTASQYYPPSRRRLRFALHVLEQEGHISALEAAAASNSRSQTAVRAALDFIQHIRVLTETTTDTVELEKDRWRKVAYAWVDSTLASATTFTLEKASPIRYDAAHLQRELPELIERLQNGIPPNETGSPIEAAAADPRSAIVAAWAFKLSYFATTDRSRQINPTKELMDLQRVTLRAIEYIIMKREYQKYTSSRKLNP